jgi:hypothetical protein
LLRQTLEQDIVSAHPQEGETMQLNWGAIVLAGVADWILGAVWFTAFKTPWQAGTRIPPEELKAYMAHPDFWPYIVSLVCSIVIAYVIARILSAWAFTLIHGIGIGILVGLAAALAMITDDKQHPHTRDEIYVIASGTGRFQREATEFSFGPGDVLFVAAGEEHRFVEFTDDFAAWVFFYGPEGGEVVREKA